MTEPGLKRHSSYSDVPRLVRLREEDGGLLFVPPQRIFMIRCTDKMVVAFLDDDRAYLGNQSLGRLIEEFPGIWMRTSRDFAVRQTEILQIQRGWVYLRNGDKAPCSRRQFMAISQDATPIYTRTRVPEEWR